ncbi:hypothetical protein N7471_010531 [Penicillium samsonianum]|uniref:uncharacterized protein n=1 Tax=Penicillium samsonianum TaxID=1882272 RepID=UPI0025481B19|nr:uncharacterized protein N7471_010531 [Penicillium samsonianum]KAJ6126038.1 hypothetical protein N7471_010531 [Penicillium samsonianum]
MNSDAVVSEVFTTGHGLSRTGTTGTMRVRCSWDIRGVALPLGESTSSIAFVRLSGHRTSWMSAQSASRRSDYQRISHPVVQGEGDTENEIHDETRRILLPQSNTEHGNDWEIN